LPPFRHFVTFAGWFVACPRKETTQHFVVFFILIFACILARELQWCADVPPSALVGEQRRWRQHGGLRMRLQNQTALVTGASAGLGRAIALALAAEGAQLVLSARRWEPLNAVASEIDRIGGDVLVAQCDVRDPASVAALVARAQEEFGKIDIAVTSAGIGLRRPFVETTSEEWDDVFGTLVRGTMLVAQAVLPGMSERKRGNIVTLAAPLERIQLPGFVTYTSAKYAVEGFTKTLAKEARRYGVNVNGLHPGGFADTPMVRGVLEQSGGTGLLDPAVVARAAVELAALPPRGTTGTIVDASASGAAYAGA
jgi:NAD(P)-dependent dehydrogenase (short-subunit alcohol dehydrogenase family)